MLGEILDALALDGTRTAAAAPTALAQLPPPVTGFTGRDDDLAVLAGLLDPAGTAGRWWCRRWPGWPGWARPPWRSRRGMRPGGGAGTAAGCCSSTCTAMTRHRWNRAGAGCPAAGAGGARRAHPARREERAGLYRSVLAEIEPVLVIADNASSEAQVRPLLPGAGPHKVLVTSRHTLAGLEGPAGGRHRPGQQANRLSCWMRRCVPPARRRPDHRRPERQGGWRGCAAGCRWPCRSPRRC